MDLVRNWLTDPMALLFLVTLLWLIRGLIKRPSVIGVMAAIGWISLMLLISAPKVVNPLLAQLEDQHPFDSECQASAIVVLGGGVSSSIADSSEFHLMSQATFARVSSAWQFWQQRNSLPIIVAGGALKTISEADVMAEYLTTLGVERERILLEGTSKNTAHNALNVAELLRLKDLPEQIWLVTSAAHMPRAKSAFAKQGMTVCAVPVDYQAIKALPSIAWMPQTTSLVKFDKWLHEVIAIVIYKLKGL